MPQPGITGFQSTQVYVSILSKSRVSNGRNDSKEPPGYVRTAKFAEHLFRFPLKESLGSNSWMAAIYETIDSCEVHGCVANGQFRRVSSPYYTSARVTCHTSAYTEITSLSYQVHFQMHSIPLTPSMDVSKCLRRLAFVSTNSKVNMCGDPVLHTVSLPCLHTESSMKTDALCVLQVLLRMAERKRFIVPLLSTKTLAHDRVAFDSCRLNDRWCVAFRSLSAFHTVLITLIGVFRRVQFFICRRCC